MARPAATRRTAGDPPRVYVALLRGINVGGKNRLAMADLAAVIEAAGGTGVRTYIQSGNAVFTADRSTAEEMPRRIGERLAADLGLDVPVILRDIKTMAGIAGANPYLRAGHAPESLHVGFLAETPDPQRVAALDTGRSPGDSFAVRGGEVYLHLPRGVAPTKLTSAYFDKALGTTITVRNWRTMLKLVELMRACADGSAAQE